MLRNAVLAVLLLEAARPAAADVMLTPVQVVQLAQSALVVLDRDPGPVDGVLGPRTRAAIDAYVAASGLEMGWNGRTLDQGQAMSLNVAAMPALERAFGSVLDGRFGYIRDVPAPETGMLLGGNLDDIDGGVDCAAAPDRVAEIDGLIVFEPGRPPVIVTIALPRLDPLPPAGAWHPETEPWHLRVVWDNVISFVRGGDHAVHGRCQ